MGDNVSRCCTKSDDTDYEPKDKINTEPQNEVRDWLYEINEDFSGLYFANFIERNYKTLALISTIQNIDELRDIGIGIDHEMNIMNAIQKLQSDLQSVHCVPNNNAHKPSINIDKEDIKYTDNHLIDVQTETTIKEWLVNIDEELLKYYPNFMRNGYTKFKYILSIENEQQLNEIGIALPAHHHAIMQAIQELRDYDIKSRTMTQSLTSTDDNDDRKDITEQQQNINYNLNKSLNKSLSIMSMDPPQVIMDADVTRPSWKCSHCGAPNFWNRKKCKLCTTKLREDIMEALKLLAQNDCVILLPSSEQQVLY